ncbi:MAG: hypothetical protein K2R93_15285 [Gemmatimonadaceae bacterium]|nr:hypothetical protein [Gemmatimonadaceae bacterium]
MSNLDVILSLARSPDDRRLLSGWYASATTEKMQTALEWGVRTQNHVKGPLLAALSRAWQFFRTQGRSDWDAKQLTLEALEELFRKKGLDLGRNFSDGSFEAFYTRMATRLPARRERLAPPTPAATEGFQPQHLPEVDDRSEAEREAQRRENEAAIASFWAAQGRIGVGGTAPDLAERKRQLQRQIASWRSA